MKYCRQCLIPDTKPHVTFNEEGVCTACLTHAQQKRGRAAIDWSSREKEFRELVGWAKSKKAPLYDALVPVSGGKDSITQVHRLLGFDARILAVNVDYGIKTEIGWRNLHVIPRMGANLILYRPNEPLHRRLVRMGFTDFGDPDLLSHTLLHACPLHLALRLQVPLVLLGENSAFEYGGDSVIASQSRITRSWFTKYAANAGRDARFVSERYGIPFDGLALYDFPDELEKSGTQAVFMSHFFPWDSEAHLAIARRYGFESLPHPAEGTYRNYAGIDEKLHRVHQYLKVLKFGYGRATDHACEDIRNLRCSRDEAKRLVRNHDLEPLSEDAIDAFLRFTELSRPEFFETLDKYRNPGIWKKSAAGGWEIEGHLAD